MLRDSQKRIYLTGKAYFITTVTRERYPYFRDEFLCRFFIDHIEFASDLLRFKAYAYAIMPDHVHLLIRPVGAFNHSRIMFSLKKQFSHNVNRVMGIVDMNDDSDGAQTFARHHRRIRQYRDEFIEMNNGVSPHPPFRWQKSYHDHFIRDDEDLRNHLRYIEIQPLKHGVPGHVWIDDV